MSATILVYLRSGKIAERSEPTLRPIRDIKLP
jgi:hypothetical protein